MTQELQNEAQSEDIKLVTMVKVKLKLGLSKNEVKNLFGIDH
ncbi:hypothetical protein ACFSTA_01695 [Ornithinibacillus salinisoli]|uniref:Uncharacterized protein n=1 Tax=Ornithinibacillus salinisoli TaxID=1848459 RepID=A0ABW4VWX7_9BACI